MKNVSPENVLQSHVHRGKLALKTLMQVRINYQTINNNIDRPVSKFFILELFFLMAISIHFGEQYFLNLPVVPI